MTRPTAIWAGDVLRALSGLGVADAADARKVAELLGWRLNLARLGAGDPVEPPPPPPPAPQPPSTPSVGEDPGQERRPTEATGAHGTARLRALPRQEPPPPPAWLETAGAMDAASQPFVPAAPEPILRQVAVRGLSIALGAALTPSAEVDVDAVIRRCTDVRPLDELPVTREWTLRHGVHLLVDDGAAMRPLASDVGQVVEAFRDAVGGREGADGPLRVTRFRGTPPDCASSAFLERGPTRVLLSDLGIGASPGAAPVEDWVHWLDAARRRGLRLLALVPYRPARWPGPIARKVRCVHWDPSSTASRVSARVRSW